MKEKKEIMEFEALARPLMEYLTDKHCPHSLIIITDTNAKIFDGVMSTGEILDYVKD
jgi:hypothetical protein